MPILEYAINAVTMIKRFQWNTFFIKTPALQQSASAVVELQSPINDFLQFENAEKLRIAEELIAAHQEIVLENIEKEEKAAELVKVKEELATEQDEKEQLATKLVVAQKDLAKAENVIHEHVEGLEEIMFMTSHKVRQPIANILGIANILDQFLKSPATIKKMVGFIKHSTLSLDGFTRELNILVNHLKRRK